MGKDRQAEHQTDCAEDGWALLRDARWQRAREVFDEAVRRAPTPELLEGLSWAAWWQDDEESLFDARRRAFQLYRDAGDSRSAARMATWLAADEVDFRGALSVANGWLERAHRLLLDLEPSPDHGWLAFHEGHVANLRGDIERAGKLGAQAFELGRRFDNLDLQMLGLALEGATLVTGGRVEEGMRKLDGATTMALEGEASVRISGAWACCFLVSACLKVFDYERAAEWCARIQEFSERYQSHYMLAYCSAEYAGIHLWKGRFDEAERSIRTSLDSARRARRPLIGMPLALLAELRRRQGRFEDCAQLLAEAGGSTAVKLCRSRLALDQGRAEDACREIERLLRQLPEHKQLDRAPALELLARARVACGDFGRAEHTAHALRTLEQQLGTRALSAYADRAEGLLWAARGESERALSLLEDAIDAFDQCHAGYEAAITSSQLSQVLEAMGQRQRAQRETERSEQRLRNLQAAERDADGSPTAAHEPVRQREHDPGALSTLTTRQREVLCCIAGGLTNRAIAQQLGVSEHTVHRHVANILTKLDLPSRTAAATLALRAGWFDDDGPN